MSAPDYLATVYASDEDLAIRCDADISILTPNSNLLAGGSDGVFNSVDPWTLTSASNDFQAQGVVVGNTIKLLSAVDSSGSAPKKVSPFGGSSGVLMAVGAIAGHSITLRRLGLGDGVGVPPGVTDLAGVTFSIETLAPQINQASDELNRRFGIDPRSAFNSPTGIYDVGVLKEACMLIVLIRKYIGDLRTKDGSYQDKIRELIAARDDVFARLMIRWGTTPDAPLPTPVQFGTRVSR